MSRWSHWLEADARPRVSEGKRERRKDKTLARETSRPHGSCLASVSIITVIARTNSEAEARTAEEEEKKKKEFEEEEKTFFNIDKRETCKLSVL